MRDVDCDVSFYAHSGVMKRHSRFLSSIQSAESMVLSLGHRVLFLVAVVITRVEAVVGILQAVIEDRMLSCVPAAVAYVQAA